MRYNLLIIFIMATALLAEAQLKLPIRMIGDTEYYYRQVKKKETLYGISKELGLTIDQIVKYNPSVKSGLKKDQWLYFPVADFTKNKQKSAAKELTHCVEQGETLYSISQIYGVSIDDIKTANPKLSSGLKSGSTIKIPLSNRDKQNKEAIPYKIKKGETLYRVSLNNHVSIESLLEANPGISPTNFKAGEIIMIPPAEKSEIEKNSQPETVFIAEKVEKGDSFESVAEKYNTTADELKDANPDRKKLKKGSYVYVPVKQERDSITNEKITATYQEIHEVENVTEINLAVILPFESKSEKPSQKAELYTDFYKGVLLAANEYADDGIKINLNAFDLSDDNFSDIIGSHSNELKNHDMIFIAGSSNDIEEASRFGKEYGVNIINAFEVNDDNSYNNDNFFQVTTPSSYMYSAVNNMVENKFNGYRLIFINDPEIETEAKPLIQHLKATGLTKQTISLDELNDTEIFSTIIPNDKKILFVPEQSSTTMLTRIKKAFAHLSAECPEYEYSLLGYPEWLNYMSSEPFFHKSDTYVYSRYTIAGDKETAKKLNEDFEYWYGKQPLNSMPQMNIFGYDLAKYFIDAIRQNNKDFNTSTDCVEGIQTCIDFKRVSNWGGFVNTAIFLVHFSPDNSVERTIIE